MAEQRYPRRLDHDLLRVVASHNNVACQPVDVMKTPGNLQRDVLALTLRTKTVQRSIDPVQYAVGHTSVLPKQPATNLAGQMFRQASCALNDERLKLAI